MLRRLLVLSLLACAAAPLGAQSLKDKVTDLFIFGSGSNPLHLGGTADPNNPASVQAHGNHFIPAAVAQNGSIITFLTLAAGQSVANVPIGSTSSGETFRFEGGVPVRTSTSAGPILAERAQTLGRGRTIVGIGRTRVPFATIRGQDLKNLEMFFTHENVDSDACDVAQGGECAQMGLPLLENEVIRVRLNLDMDVSVTTLYATYGLFDFMDVSVVMPLVSTSFTGASEATIIPFGGTTATHFFDGTPDAPVLSSSRIVSGSAFGVGDVAVRSKVLLRQTQKAAVSVFGDARFATGDETDLLGAGYFSARGALAISAAFGPFAPHINAGYLYRNTEAASDAVIGIAGFDHLMWPNVTLAVDVLSSFQVGESKFRLPQTVHIEYPFVRHIDPTSIPEMRDNIVDGSFGFKFSHQTGVTAILNALVPLNAGGLRGRTIFTAGLEFGF
ncbi:MAG: hypothetical protein ACRENU_11380 [Gemmatimonadaceae bacterium]